MIMLLALGALLIFFMFNSNRKRKAQQEQMAERLVPGATVMTTFGLYGTVVSVDSDANKVTIESTPGTTLVVHRQAIGQVEAPVVAEPTADSASSFGADSSDAKDTDAPGPFGRDDDRPTGGPFGDDDKR